MAFEFGNRKRAEGLRRYRTCAVPRVHASLLNVFHDSANDEVPGSITNGVDVDLHGIVEETINKDRTLSGQAAFFAGDPSAAISFIARRRAWSSLTICMARPPNTYDGRIRTG